MAARKKPTAAELRESYERAANSGELTQEELDRKFGKSKWFISLQAPGLAEFRIEYKDSLGRCYMNLEGERWGVLNSRHATVPFPDVHEQLELVRCGTAEIVRLRVQSVELPSPNRRATMTLICDKVS